MSDSSSYSDTQSIKNKINNNVNKRINKNKMKDDERIKRIEREFNENKETFRKIFYKKVSKLIEEIAIFSKETDIFKELVIYDKYDFNYDLPRMYSNDDMENDNEIMEIILKIRQFITSYRTASVENTELYNNYIDELIDENLTGVFHCFTGNIDQANHILSYKNFKLGIGGVLTYKKAELDKVLSRISIDNLVLETDSPYLPPVPFRGKRNESSYLLHIAERLTEVYNLTLKEVEEITTKNAKEVFNLVL